MFYDIFAWDYMPLWEKYTITHMYTPSHQQEHLWFKLKSFSLMESWSWGWFYMLINFVYCLLFFACSCFYRRPKLFVALPFRAGFGLNFIRMHVPIQTETPLWFARTAVQALRGLLCPSPMLFLRSLPRAPRAQKPSNGSGRR